MLLYEVGGRTFGSIQAAREAMGKTKPFPVDQARVLWENGRDTGHLLLRKPSTGRTFGSEGAFEETLMLLLYRRLRLSGARYYDGMAPHSVPIHPKAVGLDFKDLVDANVNWTTFWYDTKLEGLDLEGDMLSEVLAQYTPQEVHHAWCRAINRHRHGNWGVEAARIRQAMQVPTSELRILLDELARPDTPAVPVPDRLPMTPPPPPAPPPHKPSKAYTITFKTDPPLSLPRPVVTLQHCDPAEPEALLRAPTLYEAPAEPPKAPAPESWY